jgi:hypothetical protein
MFAYPSVEVTRINLRPLLPPRALERVNASKVLKALQREVFRQVRRNIFQDTFSHRAKRVLREGFDVKVGKNSITVRATHPAFRPLLEGQHARQMRWLTKSPTPIPIITDQGELIFRNATPRSMDNGHWYHPGRKPTTVLERAKAAAREVIREKIGADLRRQVRTAMLRAR